MPIIDTFAQRITSNSPTRPPSPQFSYKNTKDLELLLDVSFVANKRFRTRGSMIISLNGIEYSQINAGTFTDVRSSLLTGQLATLEAQGYLNVTIWNGAGDGVDLALTIGGITSTKKEGDENKN